MLSFINNYMPFIVVYLVVSRVFIILNVLWIFLSMGALTKSDKVIMLFSILTCCLFFEVEVLWSVIKFIISIIVYLVTLAMLLIYYLYVTIMFALCEIWKK